MTVRQLKSAFDLAVENFDQAKVLVIGDAILDTYHFGRVDRLSAEAPVPIFVQERAEVRRGGCLNVLENLKALGVQAHAITPDQPFTTKHRYMVGHHQLFRVDDDVITSQPVTPSEHVTKMIEVADVLILSDYAKGALRADTCDAIIDVALAKSTVVIVDPKGSDWSKYAGAHILCPNESELAAWGGTKHGKSIEAWNLKHDLVIKRGPRGLKVHERLEVHEERVTEHPARQKPVFDVTGAGDTVVAVLAAAIAVHQALPDAAFLANLAASVVVGKVGTSTCNRDELLEELQHV